MNGTARYTICAPALNSKRKVLELANPFMIEWAEACALVNVYLIYVDLISKKVKVFKEGLL